MSFPLEANEMQTVAIQARRFRAPKQTPNRILYLCEMFPYEINIRNLVVDPSQLTQYAREANEHEPGWDGPGCLVLLACALASSSHAYSAATARNFAEGSRQRLESLPNSLLAIQYAYLAGLYEQYVMRPESAWGRLQDACVRFQTLPHIEASSPNSANDEDRGSGTLRQRLYWSCVKAEFELRAELMYSSSSVAAEFEILHRKVTSEMATGINAVTPESLNFFGSDENPSTRSCRSTKYHEEDLLRGAMSHIMNDIYSKSWAGWIPELPNLIKKCAEYGDLLETWRKWLYLSLAFPHPLSKTPSAPKVADSAESFLLQVNYLCIVELLHRPFFACVLSRHDCIKSVGHQVLIPLAQQYLQASCALIQLVAAAYFRYEGTWTLVRRSFGCSLALLAAVRFNHRYRNSSTEPLPVPREWRKILQISIDTIWRWERPGVEDLPWMRRILEHMLEVVEK
ncbi:hypothetical protein F5B19DRAFT_498062 [Rostrohypoxylon terebratum]|nr:hypothetical protein F5B19DRAFT_498062 [Rostrohypoxylon terebratum]